MNKTGGYILIAYKPQSARYSMNCLMDTYSGDFVVRNGLTEEHLVEEVAQYRSRNEFLRHQETGYTILIIRGELIANTNAVESGLDPCLLAKVESLAAEYTNTERGSREQEQQRREKADRDNREAQERREYERLRSKYE